MDHPGSWCIETVEAEPSREVEGKLQSQESEATQKGKRRLTGGQRTAVVSTMGSRVLKYITMMGFVCEDDGWMCR